MGHRSDSLLTRCTAPFGAASMFSVFFDVSMHQYALTSAADGDLMPFCTAAEIYGFGKSEEFLGEFMQRTGTSDKAMVATKFAALPWRFTSQSVVDACKAGCTCGLAAQMSTVYTCALCPTCQTVVSQQQSLSAHCCMHVQLLAALMQVQLYVV